MDVIANLITEYSHSAHWIVFFAIILAGANIPISIDFIILTSAIASAQLPHDQMYKLFLGIWGGCYFAAWVSYWMGRLLSDKLQKWPFFSKTLSPARLEKVGKFYGRHGFWTLLIGRFIPFGVRNCIFMTTGMTKSSFRKFIIRDFFACTLWCSLYFFTFYFLGQNFEVVYSYLKTFNVLIFSAFGVAVIGLIWYKRRKSTSSKTEIEES